MLIKSNFGNHFITVGAFHFLGFSPSGMMHWIIYLLFLWQIENTWVIILNFVTPAFRACVRIALWFPPIRATTQLADFPLNYLISYIANDFIPLWYFAFAHAFLQIRQLRTVRLTNLVINKLCPDNSCPRIQCVFPSF